MSGDDPKLWNLCDAYGGEAASFGCFSHREGAAICLCEKCGWRRIAEDLQRKYRPANDNSWMHPWGCGHP